MVFQPLPLADIMVTVKLVQDEPDTKPSTEPHPHLDPIPIQMWQILISKKK